MTIVDEIEAVLNEEQELLLSGNLAALEALVERKSRLASRLANVEGDLPREAYSGLKDRAVRNEALIGAAQRGLQAALAQLRRLSEAGDQNTYSRDGQRRPMSRQPSSVREKY